MALIQVNFLSEALMRTVPVQVILPVDKMGVPGSTVREEKPFKTLYLLHGIFGNYTDWVSGTNIQRWAEERSLAVVMPSGDNMVYVGQKEGEKIQGKMELLLRLFVELPYHVEIYYERHFGIMGVDCTMELDAMTLC